MATQSDILKTSLLAGEIMLKNGAETYRVEDTMKRICVSSSLEYAETFVTPTGIFVSVDDESHHPITLVKRIEDRTTNLEKVALVNNLSRLYVKGDIDFETLHLNLKEVEKKQSYKNIFFIIASGFGSAFSCLVFGGNLLDFIISFIIGSILGINLFYLNKTNLYPFIINVLSGALVCFLAIMIKKYVPINIHLDKVISGSIMPTAPGVAITNAVRDYMYGDLVSGTSRAAEAFMAAVSVAIGTGVVLKLLM